MQGDRCIYRFRQVWKPRRGHQRKSWSREVDGPFSSLGLDKAEWVKDIQKGECSLKGFPSVVGESMSGKVGVESKAYLHGYVMLGL